MSKKNIAIAMGGYSSEFEISLKSGNVVAESLDKNKYNIYHYHILKNNWKCVLPNGEHVLIDKSTFGFTFGNETIIPHVVFNTIHGTPGEDGYLAAYLEILNIPQTSTGFYQAALSFNKRDCLSVLKNFGVHCATSFYINKGDAIDPEIIIAKVGLPCFVKPNRAGSSFGISKINTTEALLPAIENAFKEDTEIIIESALVGTEVSIGVYESPEGLNVLNPTEIVSENEFFDYEAKYLGKSQEITPARISASETKNVKNEALKIYKILNMKGVTRSEFIIQNGIPYFIETNTTPGLSKESIIPKQTADAGISLQDFFGMLIENALAKK
ncbi:D-alanine--D-alanine ligase [Patiriisocius marinistellae]|uniref:D-alanine--D-alanine ligase n=1 Tax=Patiriisocius marinistellae TaxID=2494560 RepID=A0A5J4FYV7_9FLAO|nr:D-alanine--D-alanine ligase [Patiriisocius marinistellae]GEQ87263.1 D-alanine--D-alanine ligase [Patiriisocius marinistellae]